MWTALFVFFMLGLTLLPPFLEGAGAFWMLGNGPLPLTFFTHPWVHQGAYHLLLDGSAFLGLWGMVEGGTARRLRYLGWTNLGSTAAVLATGLGDSGGFGGLSGIAHGLMAVVVLDWIRSEQAGISTAGKWLLAALLGKCVFEVCTGTPFFSGLHLGELGLRWLSAIQEAFSARFVG